MMSKAQGRVNMKMQVILSLSCFFSLLALYFYIFITSLSSASVAAQLLKC